ncbi:MAG: phosphatidylserine decarboxylase family protein [Acidobacteria bacterium]|nr:phosphatidylserine decarboxylase family protein [Acidobacteriota bacterium]
MTIDRAGWPFVLAAAAPVAVCGWIGLPWLAAAFALVAVFMLYFFRDPERVSPDDPRAVVSPADGRVMIAGQADPAAAPEGSWKQVSIFLSPVDVHINRIPFAGTVTRVEYTPGRFFAAYKWESATLNERNDVWIDHAGESLVCRQVVGVLARRLVCRVAPGAQVRAGERFGLMKFGSRIDLFLPLHVDVRVAVGDRVRSGETVVATW